jgi:tetratricopeptide (TPR) repeat protein
MGCSSLRQRNLSTRGHFKHMKTRFITGIFLSLATCLLFVNSSQAQQARTGTHLNSKAQPSEVLLLEVPDEVENIRQMLLSGRKNEALLAAESYIEKVERLSLRHETLPRYYAWNACCTVLTSLQRVEEAIAACSSAMGFEPGKWSALNNRGTAKFVGGRIAEALSDYQAALLMVDESNERVRATIEHNISLAMQQQ